MDRVIVRLLPTVPRPVVQRLSAPYIAGCDSRRRPSDGRRAERRGEARDRGRARGGGDEAGQRRRRSPPRTTPSWTRSGAIRLDANVSVKLDRARAEARPRALPLAARRRLVADACRARRPSCASTWRTRPAPTTRSPSTASCAARGARTSGSSSRRCLRRTVDDVAALAALRPSVRLCKGIYVEPRASRSRTRRDPRELRPRASTRCSRRGATSAWRRTTSSCPARARARAGHEPRGVRVPDAARRARAPRRRSSSPRAIASASTSLTASAGTSTRSGACRRTRSSRRCSRRRPPAASSRAAEVAVHRQQGPAPAVDDQRLAADHRGVRRAEERRRTRRRPPA